jgi:FdhE protein
MAAQPRRDRLVWAPSAAHGGAFMRQGESAPKGSWIGNATGGVKAPEPIVLPNPGVRFARTAERLEQLADGHAAEGWLAFMAEASRAQGAAAANMPRLRAPDETAIAQAVAARLPPVAADGHRRDPAWRKGLALMLESFDAKTFPPSAAATIAELRTRDAMETERLAGAFLRDGVDPADAGAAFWIAAALQVYFTRLAATLRAGDLRLLERRDLCPSCGSTSSAGVITASGQNPGARYLYCSLCSTAWHHTRAICIVCGGSRTLSLRGLEGDSGLARAETCDECGTYAKVFYEAKGPDVDAYADDLATLGLDMMVGEAGWSRHAPHPLLMVS